MAGDKATSTTCVRQYWNARDELPVPDGVIYRGMRIVIPPSMRSAMLGIIHETHQGIVKCKERARETLYWPGMSAQIEEKMKDCFIFHDYFTAQQNNLICCNLMTINKLINQEGKYRKIAIRTTCKRVLNTP